MPEAPQPLSKRDPTVAAILRRWRALTGGNAVADAGRPTLVACSGGADSTALSLALHAAGGLAGLLHVVHDLRPEPDALRDRDAVRTLAGALKVPFHERSVLVRGLPGSVEASARRLRYGALAEAAAGAGVFAVATGHHADDQFETVLMRLARGAGPRGLAGIRPRRRLGRGVVVIRPCLTVGRAALAGLCAAAGLVACEDATNADRRLARNAVRALVAPELERLYPGASGRMEEFGRRMRQLAAVVDAGARGLGVGVGLGGGETPRAGLAGAPRAVAHAALRRAVAALCGGSDRLAWRTGDRIIAAVRDGAGGVRRFRWGGAEVQVGATWVRIAPAQSSS